jgi:hypothetical protein
LNRNLLCKITFNPFISPTKNLLFSPLPNAPNSDQTYRPEESSEITSLDMTPKLSTNNYERTPRAPLIQTTNQQKSSKLRVPRVQVRLNFLDKFLIFLYIK